jgi:rod shape-determining protein MreC
LVSDAAHAIPVQVNRNGLRTIAQGTGDTSHLKLPYLSTSADVVVGDLLVTSGLGGGFPPGYPVGTVSEVKRDPAQSLADVEVRPAAALDRSRELMFVWLRPGAPVAPQPSAPRLAPGTAAPGVATPGVATPNGPTPSGTTPSAPTPAAATPATAPKVAPATAASPKTAPAPAAQSGAPKK